MIDDDTMKEEYNIHHHHQCNNFRKVGRNYTLCFAEIFDSFDHEMCVTNIVFLICFRVTQSSISGYVCFSRFSHIKSR